MDTLLVLHQGALGDFLLSLPVIQAAREHLHAQRCLALASAASARLAAGHSVVDAWACPEQLGLYRLFCRELEPAESLAEVLHEARWVLNLLCGPQGCVHARLADLTTGELVSIDPRPSSATRAERRHITAQWADDLRAAGWGLDDPRAASIRLPAASRSTVQRVLIHPGSGGASKCWPMDRFIALADALSAMEVTWMVGPADEAAARRLHDRPEPILFEPDLARVAGRMAGASLYVGNDSGLTHLAAALEVPTIAIFGTTDPNIWRPLGDHVTVIAPAEVNDGMDCIAAEPVIAAALRKLQPRQKA